MLTRPAQSAVSIAQPYYGLFHGRAVHYWTDAIPSAG
jgi:hypothetical protein